jgi:hypothetical protein
MAVAAAVAGTGLSAARGAVNWTGTGGTSWSTGTSWSNNVGPAALDTASFSDAAASSFPGDMTSFLDKNYSIGGLTFSNSASKYHTLDLNGKTLTISNLLAFNADKAGSTLTTVRNGTLTVDSSFANVYVGSSISANASGTVSLSGLTALTINGQSFQVGTSTSSSASGTVTLAPMNTINVASMQVGASTGGGDSSGTLHLGLNNTILANQLDVAKNNANGLIDIVNGATFTLGSAAQRTIVQVANQNTNTPNVFSGTVNLGNAAVNLHIADFIVGEKNGGSGNVTAQFLGGGSGSAAIGDASARSTWYVGYAPSGGAISGTVDFSRLGSVQAYVTDFFVGNSLTGAAGGNVSLGASNTIDASNSILVGAGSGGNGTLTLGASNTILTNQLVIGQKQSSGLVNIVNNGAVTLGSASQRVGVQIANENFNQNADYTGTLDLGNAAVDLHVGDLVVAQKAGGAGNAIGKFLAGGSGAVTIGDLNARSTWYVGYTTFGGGATGTVDFSRLNNVQAYVTDLFIGNAPNSIATGTVTLGASNTIDASNSIVVGGGGGGTGLLTLGKSNTILTNQLLVGVGTSNGTLNTVNNASVTLGSASLRPSVQIANENFGFSVDHSGTVDFGNAAVDLHIGDLIVGQKAGGAGNAIGQFLAGGSGSVAIGDPAARSIWYVGYTPNGGMGQGTVDFSRLGNVQAYVTELFIGNAPSSAAKGTVTLGADNLIDASNSIVIGAGSSATGTLNLGPSNTILANQLTIGQDYSTGTVTIASGGSVTLGSPARRMNVSIGVATTNTNQTYTGMLDLTNATLTAYLDNVIVGNKNAQPGAEQGTFTISSNPANHVEINTLTLGGNQSTGTLNFGGGILYGGSIQRGTGTANFNWTGGTLSVGSFGAPAMLFNLSNNNTGILAPGTAGGAISTTNVYGNYTQGSAATMAIDIAGVAPGTGNDLVAISGTASLAGTLALKITSGFVPTLGQNLVIATFASRTGTFGFVAPPKMPQDVAFQVDYTSSPTQLFIHMVTPTNQNFVGASATNTFGTASNWDTNATPTTTSNLAMINTGAAAKTVSVLSSTTVHRISLGAAATPTITLEVPQGIQLGVANQLVVNANGVLSGGGQVLGDIVLNGGTLASFGTISGNVVAGGGGNVIAPSDTLGSGSHSTVSMTSLTTSPTTTLKFNLTSPGANSVNDRIIVTRADGLTLSGGAVQIPSSGTGAGSLGFYRAIQYTGGFSGNLANIAMPAAAGGIVYTLDAAHDPGFIDIHRGFVGDSNDDGTVNFADFVRLSNNYGQLGKGWAGADYNGDGLTNFSDFVILSNNYGKSIAGDSFVATGEELAALQAFASSAAVPEPASLALLSAGAMALLARRRRAGAKLIQSKAG